MSYITLNCRSGPLPQVDAIAKVASFVQKEDKEDSLLIVYYAGHGKKGKATGQLLLFGYVVNPTGRDEQKLIPWQGKHIGWDYLK